MRTERPYPGDVAADTADARFWAACADGRYLLARCGSCGLCLWPAGACPEHGTASMGWVESPGRGRLHTWTVVHQQYPTSFPDPPANVAVIELDEGVFVHSTVVDAPTLRIGMRVEVAFREMGPEVVLPVFRPVREFGPGEIEEDAR